MKIIQPRLTILGAGHPFRIIEMLNSEKSFKKGSDGFISRFVFCTPRPLRMSVLNLTDVPKKLFNVNYLMIRNI
jgi:hypothetical protein